MVKKSLLLIASLFLITSIFGQQSGSEMYVVSFADKGVTKNAKINASKYFSEKSVERRLRQKISFDQADIPLNEQYLKEVSKSGVKILTRSRWLNTIVIEADNQAVTNIRTLPFVSSVKPINSLSKQQSISASQKPFFESETVSPWINEITKQVSADSYIYGTAFNQINQLKGQSLHNMGFSGQGMTIAVIDAGFNSVDKMSCFDSLRANQQILGTRDFAQPGNDVYATTMNSHGTMVLSCMAANSSGQMVGTSPKANFWLLRSEVASTESIIEEYYWVNAAEFADSVGADLINSSLGYTTFDNPATNHTYADMDGKTTVVTKGAEIAAQKGILVVNSAGNGGSVTSTWKYIGAPADGDSVFTIGAVDAAGNRAYFSSLGPTYDKRIKPTVAAQGLGSAVFAPGGTANPGGVLSSASGTSFSSPIICGITACLWQAMPNLSNIQIIESIKATSSQASQPDTLLGWGIPDFSLALLYLSIQSSSAGETTLYAFPNPFTNNVTIGFPKPIRGKYNLEVVNLQGKALYTQQSEAGSTVIIQINDLENLAAGIYVIKVSNGSQVFTGKIIKM
jgi:serine protease AprX